MSDYDTYCSHIAAYDREFEKWIKRGDKIGKIYRDDQGAKRTGSRFNVLWSNVQTLKAATFSRMPQPDVSRRFRDNDPVGRVAGMMLERALDFEIEHYKDFSASVRQCVYDRFLPGRGVAWVRYEPTFKQVQMGEQTGQPPEDGEMITEDAESESEASEELDFECAPVDYVHWRDFGHEVSRTWEEVSKVWRKVYLGRSALIERFGEELGKAIPLDALPDDQKIKQSADSDSVLKRALLYEIWDKETGQCVFLSKSLGKIIDALDDPLGLEEFFPCPPPLYATLSTDTLVPVPDFTLYQDQARALDELSQRIDGLVKALQVRGVYDASIPELARLFGEAENNDLIPVKNWAAFAEKQGLKGAIDLVDVLPIAQALNQAYGAFAQIKGQIYEITGISDIVRGETAPQETATAQQIKNSYASLRLKTYQDEVERFVSRILNLKAQIICNHFDAETICEISGCDQLSQEDQKLVPQALALLKNNVTRMFRIEVTTDSMVYQDEQQDKQERMELLGAVSGFLKEAVPVSQSVPPLAPLMTEFLQFIARGFRIGKSIEGTIDQAAEGLRQMAQQPKPDPNAAKAQAASQQTQVQEQSETQRHMASEQAETQREAMRLQGNQQLEAFRAQNEARLQAMEQAHDQSQASTQAQLHLILQGLKNLGAIEVAEVSKNTTLQAAQVAGAREGMQ
jgi:hypothetical protein